MVLPQAQQAVLALAAECAAAAPAHSSSCGNGSGPAAATHAQWSDADASNFDSKRSGNGSHPPVQPSGGCLPVLLCGDMNAEPESSACEVRSKTC
jgi:hypothetical protein